MDDLIADFVAECREMLEALGGVAKQCGCAVQTHCSESDWQHGYAFARHGISDSEVLDRFGLLTRRTVLAHGNLLSPSDMERVKSRGAGVAHCPLSNVYFSNAVFPLRAALAKGLRVGLGTDIAGGTSQDCDSNGTPDECEAGTDCNTNGTLDACDIAGGTSLTPPVS